MMARTSVAPGGQGHQPALPAADRLARRTEPLHRRAGNVLQVARDGMARIHGCERAWLLGRTVGWPGAGTLTINGSLEYLRKRGLVYGLIKGDRPPRRFKLTADLIAAITWHLQRLDTQRKLMVGKWQDSPYLFVTPKTGGPINPGELWRHFKMAARSVGLGEYRLHDLRHSCASYLKAKGWDVKRISVHLGHANTTITNNLYIHLFSDALESAAEDVEEYINADRVQKRGRI